LQRAVAWRDGMTYATAILGSLCPATRRLARASTGTTIKETTAGTIPAKNVRELGYRSMVRTSTARKPPAQRIEHASSQAAKRRGAQSQPKCGACGVKLHAGGVLPSTDC
jgi:hypothetical protein